MTRLLTGLACLALVVVLGPSPASANDRFQQASGPELHLDVVATDDRGAPVTDLKPSEFEAWIAGYRVPIDDVYAINPETTPRSLVLLLDDVLLDPLMAERAREAARLFVAAMGDADRLAVATLGGARTAFTSDRTELLAAIDRYKVRGLPVYSPDVGEQVLRVITRLSTTFPETAARRKSIVAIGAPSVFDTPMPLPSVRDLQQEWVTAMRAMAAVNCSLYVIDAGGLRAAGYTDSGKSGFASESGGRAFIRTNDIAGAVRQIWTESGSYYVLAVKDPPVQRAADLRRVEIRILRKGVTAHARRGIKGKP